MSCRNGISGVLMATMRGTAMGAEGRKGCVQHTRKPCRRQPPRGSHRGMVCPCTRGIRHGHRHGIGSRGSHRGMACPCARVSGWGRRRAPMSAGPAAALRQGLVRVSGWGWGPMASSALLNLPQGRDQPIQLPVNGPVIRLELRHSCLLSGFTGWQLRLESSSAMAFCCRSSLAFISARSSLIRCPCRPRTSASPARKPLGANHGSTSGGKEGRGGMAERLLTRTAGTKRAGETMHNHGG